MSKDVQAIAEDVALLAQLVLAHFRRFGGDTGYPPVERLIRVEGAETAGGVELLRPLLDDPLIRLDDRPEVFLRVQDPSRRR